MNKVLILSLALVIASAAHAFSQTKPGEGFYLVVYWIPNSCKAKIDGFYHVSPDGRISLPAVNIEAAAEKDIEVLRKKLQDAIQRYCHQLKPDGNAWPELHFVSEEEVKKVGNGVLVAGQVMKPGVIPLTEGLTPGKAAPAAGGLEGLGSVNARAVLRAKECIDVRFGRRGIVNDILLKPGDVVVVPRKVMVEGGADLFGY